MWGGLVPWSAETIVGQRLEFCKFAQGDDVNFTELCERYGIRTKTGYKWLNCGVSESLIEIARFNFPRVMVGLRDGCWCCSGCSRFGLVVLC